jgi:hypothetical protein
VNGELAQLVALAAHGNAWLAGPGDRPAPDLERTNSTFQHVSRVWFRFAPTLAAGGEVGTVADWLAGERRLGTLRLRLQTPVPRTGSGQRLGRLPDRIASSFSGGVDWGLIAEGQRTRRAWWPDWTFQPAPDIQRGSWHVSYDEGRVPRSGLKPARDVASAMSTMLAAIERAAAFAATQDWDDWRDWLTSAATATVPRFHPDLLPVDAHSADARRLVAIAASAWVFGGMGSWNDIAPTGRRARRTYDAVSDDLYRAITAALVTAVDHGLLARPS